MTRGLRVIVLDTLYPVLAAVCSRHHAIRASRSAIDRAFIRTYIITDTPRTASEPRERPVRLCLMLADRPVRITAPRIALHDGQRTPSVTHHEAAFTGRTLYCRVLRSNTVFSRGETGRVHAGWPYGKSQLAPTATAQDTLLTVFCLVGPIHLPPYPYHSDDMSNMNGYADDHDDDHSDSPPRRVGSESPLSDVNDLPTTAVSHMDDQTPEEASDDDAMQDMATSEVEEEDEVAAEQDADFDEETPPPEATNGMRHDGSSSEEDVRSGKRRGGAVDDEQYMKQNPELYGLRRSVRTILPAWPT